MPFPFRAGLALLAAVPCLAFADDAADLKALRDEIATLRSSYEQRLQALEARLQAAEAKAAAPAPGVQPAPAQAALPAPPMPVGSAAPGTATAGTGFNPAVSLILSGLYTRTSRDPQGFRIRNVPLPPDAEIGPGPRGFSLVQSELGLSANIDPWFSGVANIAFHPDNSVSVEEAYVQTTSLGSGFTLKAGRFLSGIGYLNPQHPHTWDFVDAPLAYQAMLGNQVGDDGVQVAWLAPTDQFFELRGELGRGRSYPGNGAGGNGAGSGALIAHTGGDIGESQSWRAGLSLLRARASDQALDALDAAGTPVTNAFTGTTRVWIADGVWKWAPNGNATRTNFKLQGEYLRGTREGTLVADATGAALAGAYRAVQSGWYLQGIYQFMPRWRVGLRTERMDGGLPTFGGSTASLAPDEGVARRNSLMLDWSPSEFSRVRLQLARDASRPGGPDNQLWLQYLMSLGAHGAHSF
ncbi:hypothetical protein ACPWT1_21690 [Ramlibacter sp. MMS24-I3-19]|uniref:hypothetical protein n=1 Tax=Ramlibacter sp. MMS24-I3-19 TaxID=3416606 RepID=UPI003D062A98